MEVLGYVAIICIGFLLGSVGAGGSMLAIPVLVYVFSIDVETASAYSLFLVGISSISGALLKHSEQLVSIRTVLRFGIPSLAGAFVSRNWIILYIPDVLWDGNGVFLSKEDLLLALFALLAFASAVTMLLKKEQNTHRIYTPKWFLLMVTGTLTGLTAGLVGAGGGFLIVPALILFAALPFSRAAGTSLVIIASNSLFGFCGDMLNRSIDWPFLLGLTVLATIGLLLGYWLHRDVQKLFSQRRFAWFVMLMGVSILAVQMIR